MMKKAFFIVLLSLLGVGASQAATVSLLEQGGWFESAYVTWQKVAGLEYNVYVSPASSDAWTQLDDELVREYPSYGRADALGLTAGNYKFKVVPVSDGEEQSADAAVSPAVSVKAHDRSGFAHVGKSGIGAYNNDGTLKSGAKVIYVWANNAKTVSTNVVTNNKGGTTTGTGLQDIIALYQNGYETTPLAIRIIGTIKAGDMDRFDSSAEGLQVKGKNSYSDMPITIEGVGTDAAISGFGILCRNASDVEFRNFAIMLCMDDCLSLDTDNSHIWIHNMDFFYGNTGGDADQAKGDGTVDIKKKSTHITVSYNHFIDCGKTSLGGMKSETPDCWMSYHHNWFDHSDSRHPRVRTAFYHVYNNYFDGVSKYGVGVTSGGSSFVENNYFRNTKYPMLISKQGTDAEGSGTFSGEPGGVIKAYNNLIVGERKVQYWNSTVQSTGAWDAVLVTDRAGAVTATAYSGGTGYNSQADAAARTTYIEKNLEEPSTVKATVTGDFGAGRLQHGDFKWSFNNSLQDENYGVISELKTALQSYKSTLVGFFGGSQVSNGGATSTVDGGDGKGLNPDTNDSYVPSWAGGSGSSYVAGLPDPRFCGAEAETGSGVYDYLWFNAANQATVQGYITAGQLVLTDGSSFKPTAQPAGTGDNASVVCDYTGVLDIAASGSVTFYCEKGVASVSARTFRTGNASGEIQISTDGTSFTKLASYETKKDDQTISASANESAPAWVRITNAANGHFYVSGVRIMYPDPNGTPDTPDPGNPDEPTTSDDATADFTVDGSLLGFVNFTSTITLAADDPATSVSVTVEPAEGASVASVSGATASGSVYTIAAPAEGQSTTATFTIKAENGTTTRNYAIIVKRAASGTTGGGTADDNTDLVLYFKGQQPSNTTFYTITSPSYKTKYGSETYKGITSDISLEPQSSTSIRFTTTKDATLKIVYGTQGKNRNIKLDGGSKTTETEIAIAAGQHEITKGDASVEIFFIDVIYADDGTGTEPQPASGDEKPYIATADASGNFDYYWFNASNASEVEGWLADGTITLTDGTTASDGTQSKSSFKKDTTPGNASVTSEKAGTIEIAKAGASGGTDGGAATFYCKNGVETFKLYLFRTGTFNFHVYRSTNGTDFSEVASDTQTGKGKLEANYSTQLKTREPVWVKIQNSSTGGLNIQGVVITYLDDTDGISTVSTERWSDDAPCYDLTGRRVTAPKAGQLYIRNGRKFIFR